jgi:hypothetical protein
MSTFRHEGRRSSAETPPRCRDHLYAKEAIIETTRELLGVLELRTGL